MMRTISNNKLNNKNDIQFKSSPTINTARDAQWFVANYSNFRHKMIANSSLKRCRYAKLNVIQHKLLERFCTWYQNEASSPSFDKHTTLITWAEFYTNMEEVSDSIDGLSSDNELEFKKALIEYEEKINRLFESMPFGE